VRLCPQHEGAPEADLFRLLGRDGMVGDVVYSFVAPDEFMDLHRQTAPNARSE
jgi:hypothetical protein